MALRVVVVQFELFAKKVAALVFFVFSLSEGLCNGIDMSLVEACGEEWWVMPKLDPKPRVRRFTAWLAGQNEPRILVVGHSNYFACLMAIMSEEKTNAQFSNCAPVLCRFNSSIPALSLCPNPRDDHSKLTLKLVRSSNHKDMRTVVVAREAGVRGVVDAGRHKWGKRSKAASATTDTGLSLTDELVKSLPSGTTILLDL